MQVKIDNFFDGKIWKSLKVSKLGIEIAYDIVKEIVGHDNILFLNSDHTPDYDPKHIFCSMSDKERLKLYEINDCDSYQIYKFGNSIMRKIGSGMFIQFRNGQTGYIPGYIYDFAGSASEGYNDYVLNTVYYEGPLLSGDVLVAVNGQLLAITDGQILAAATGELHEHVLQDLESNSLQRWGRRSLGASSANTAAGEDASMSLHRC